MGQLGKYGLPLKVEYCKKCTFSNQKPSSAIEFQERKGGIKRFTQFDDDHICEACRYSEIKKEIDWTEREKMLQETCNRFRKKNGEYDVIVPGSGGKDSVMAAHILKYKYNMNPILITWPPAIYTKIGRRNFNAWLDLGFANFTYHQNRKLHRFLTKQSFLNLCHPFQPFILGQKNLAPKLSIALNIPFIMWGENPAEYGNDIKQNDTPLMGREFYTTENAIKDLTLGGIPTSELIKDFGYSLADLEAYCPANPHDIQKVGTEVHCMGYYIKWHPQEVYYYSVQHGDFKPNFERTEGSYSKYSSLDDRMDWLHFYTMYIKFGMGRATYDSAQEIRNGDLTREEAISLVKRFDGEFPNLFLQNCCDYMGINLQEFHDTIEKFRTPHLWKQEYGTWKLKYPIWEIGI